LEEIEQMENEVKQQIEDAITFARESPYPEPGELFEDMFANPIPLE
jgi:TPP-dependent pyruvate/acetoin dehydrogenase alpha subunit